MISPARVDFGIRCLMHIDIVCVTFLLAELSVYVELRQTLGTASAKVCVTFFGSPISVLRRRHVFVFGDGSIFSQGMRHFFFHRYRFYVAVTFLSSDLGRASARACRQCTKRTLKHETNETTAGQSVERTMQYTRVLSDIKAGALGTNAQVGGTT